MIRLYLIPVIGLCVLFSACSNPTASNTDPDSSINKSPEAQQTDKIDKIQSALSKAHSATEKASNSVHSALDKVDKTVQSASKIVEDVMTIKTQLGQISTDAGNTLTAVQSGDFKTAQQEFAQLQGNWATIQAPIQKHSPDAHQQITSYIANIDSLLKQPNPDQTKLVKELSSFSDKNLTLLDIYSKADH